MPRISRLKTTPSFTPEASGERHLQYELFFDHALLPSGWARNVRISVADGTILSIAEGATREGAERIAGIAIPGLPNLHCHAFQRGMAGLAERRGTDADSFWTWREVIYRFLDRLSPDDVQAITAFAYMQMLEAGFTMVGEFHYLHHDIDGRPYTDLGEMAARIAAACAETRIGLTLLPSFYAYGGFGGAPPAAGQRRFLNDPDRFRKLVERTRAIAAGLPNAQVGIAPHSLRAVTAETLRIICQAMPEGPIHIHAGAGEGSGREPRRPWPSAGGMAARQRRDRFTLVRDSCYSYDRSRDTCAGSVRGRGRSMSDYRGVAW